MRHHSAGLTLGAMLVDRVQAHSVATYFLAVDGLLQSGVPLKRILATARILHGRSFEPLLALKALTCFEGGDLGSIAQDVRWRLVEAAINVDPAHPPVVRRKLQPAHATSSTRSCAPLKATPELLAIAKRVIWFEPPAAALANPTQLIAYAARYATAEDMARLRKYMSDDASRWALDHAPPGVIDARSWCYWNAILGRYPAPPMPVRTFGGGAASLTPSSSDRASRASCRRTG